MTSPAVHLLPCCYTWLWFVALLKLCLFRSCKWNAKRGQCPCTHLLVSGLSGPQSRFCLIQTEAKLWGKCMDDFDDRQQKSFTPSTPLTIKAKGPWISNKCRWTFKRNECRSVEHSSQIRVRECLQGNDHVYMALRPNVTYTVKAIWETRGHGLRKHNQSLNLSSFEPSLSLRLLQWSRDRAETCLPFQKSGSPFNLIKPFFPPSQENFLFFKVLSLNNMSTSSGFARTPFRLEIFALDASLTQHTTQAIMGAI